MAPPDNLLYEYALIRYVPRIDREEFVNIGMIMLNKRNKWMKARIIIDEERIRALFPKADINCLRTQSRLFEDKDVPGKDLPIEEKYRWLTAAKSACLQVSPSHPGLILNAETTDKPDDLMEKEFSRLFNSLIL